MKVSALIQAIKKKQSFLCVGLDTDIQKLPEHLPKTIEGALEFNMAIIEATAPFAVAYKLNTAFYEAMGLQGWELLHETQKALPSDVFSIADAKRGDIGNTSTMYAQAFFEQMNFDAVTVAPYMGQDSVQPFLEFKDKVTIVLGLTSNKGSSDFQTHPSFKPPLYQHVLKTISAWAQPDQLMFVVGATKADKLTEIRNIIPNHFLLVPGVGAQGGSAAEVCKYGANKDGGLLINSSRGIIYSSSGEDFAESAASEAKKLQLDMKPFTSGL